MVWQKLGCRIWPINFGISIGCSILTRNEILKSGQAEQLEFYCPIFAKPLPLCVILKTKTNMKWVITIGIAILLVGLFLLFRSCNATEDVSIWGPQYCSMERLEFQELFDTTSVSQGGEMEGSAKANGKATMPTGISIDSLKAELKGGQRAFINKKTKRIVVVSQKFYEDYSRMRLSICAIVDEVKSRRISNEKGKEKAQDLFFEIVRSFSGIDDKKSSTNNENHLELSDLRLEAFFVKTDGTLTPPLSQEEIDKIATLRTFPDGEENGLHLQFQFEKNQLDSFKNFQFNFGKPFSDRLGSNQGNPIGWSPELRNGTWIYVPTNFRETINFEVAYLK